MAPILERRAQAPRKAANSLARSRLEALEDCVTPQRLSQVVIHCQRHGGLAAKVFGLRVCLLCFIQDTLGDAMKIRTLQLIAKIVPFLLELLVSRAHQADHFVVELLHIFTQSGQRTGARGLRFIFGGDFCQVPGITQGLSLG